jgi:hypothetical protein
MHGPEWKEVYPNVWMSIAGVICLETSPTSAGWVYYPDEAASIPSGPYPTLAAAQEVANGLP